MIKKKHLIYLSILFIGIFLILTVIYQMSISHRVEIDLEPYSNIDRSIIDNLHSSPVEFKVSPKTIELKEGGNSIEFYFMRVENPTDYDIYDYKYGGNEYNFIDITTKPLNNYQCKLKVNHAPIFVPANSYNIFHGRIYNQNYGCKVGDLIEINFEFNLEQINLTHTDSLLVKIVE